MSTRPALKLWGGLHAKKARADRGPANDIARRRPAAKDALHVALSWKGHGRLANERRSVNPAGRDSWADLQVTRIAVTEANTYNSFCSAHMEALVCLASRARRGSPSAYRGCPSSLPTTQLHRRGGHNMHPGRCQQHISTT